MCIEKQQQWEVGGFRIKKIEHSQPPKPEADSLHHHRFGVRRPGALIFRGCPPRCVNCKAGELIYMGCCCKLHSTGPRQMHETVDMESRLFLPCYRKKALLRLRYTGHARHTVKSVYEMSRVRV